MKHVKCADDGCDGGCAWIREDHEPGYRRCPRDGTQDVPVVSVVRGARESSPPLSPAGAAGDSPPPSQSDKTCQLYPLTKTPTGKENKDGE